MQSHMTHHQQQHAARAGGVGPAGRQRVSLVPRVAARGPSQQQHEQLQRCHAVVRRRSSNSSSSSSSGAREPLAEPPAFDGPDRQPTPEEARSIAVGAALTPEQQRAQQLQLPITQRVRLPPGVASPRQIMAQLQAAVTWQELAAAVYKHQQPQPAATPAHRQPAPPPPSSPPPPPQQQAPLLPGKQRRKQPVQPLNLGGGGGGGSGSGSSGSSSSAGTLEQQTQPHSAEQQQQQRVPAPGMPALNALHLTEAFRRLPALLPAGPKQLPQADRAHVAALLQHLSQLAVQQCQAGDMDARGIAHVALAASKLGHHEPSLLAALEAAALERVDEFSARHTALLLVALANTPRSREPVSGELLPALLQHLLASLHLFEEQSLSASIQALAKLQPAATAAGAAADGGSSSGQGVVGGKQQQQQQQQQLVAALVQRCDPQMHRWRGRHLAQAAWGLARLGAAPGPAWREAFLQASATQLRRMNVLDLTNVLSALPALGIHPQQAWLDTWCASTASKLPTAQPVGIYSALFGLARLKQAQQRAAARAARRLQQQQQQQWDAPGAYWGGAGTDDPAADQGGGGAAAPAADAPATTTTAGRCPVTSLAELRLLRAAALWMTKRQGMLQGWRLAGVITALSELLPQLVTVVVAAPAGSAAAGGRGGGEAPVAAPPAPPPLASEEQRRWEETAQQLLEMLSQELLPVWEGAVDGLVAAAATKQQGRLVTLAWRRLVGLTGYRAVVED